MVGLKPKAGAWLAHGQLDAAFGQAANCDCTPRRFGDVFPIRELADDGAAGRWVGAHTAPPVWEAYSIPGGA
jgi:hypothetical protein